MVAATAVAEPAAVALVAVEAALAVLSEGAAGTLMLQSQRQKAQLADPRCWGLVAAPIRLQRAHHRAPYQQTMFSLAEAATVAELFDHVYEYRDRLVQNQALCRRWPPSMTTHHQKSSARGSLMVELQHIALHRRDSTLGVYDRLPLADDVLAMLDQLLR